MNCFQFLEGWRSTPVLRKGSLIEAAARYVEVADRQDIGGLVSMLAEPCDFFGEVATSAGVERHLRDSGGTERQTRVQLTKPFELAPGDSHTVEFEYVKTWKQGQQFVQVVVGEFVTFAVGAPLVARVGYTRKPSDPVVVEPELC